MKNVDNEARMSLCNRSNEKVNQSFEIILSMKTIIIIIQLKM